MQEQSLNTSRRTNPQTSRGEMELWGGVEYTCNRVGDRYLDQIEFSGHSRRRHDFEQIAALGIKTLRLGLLWERYAREQSWQWSDATLRSVAECGMKPIAGLLHHGSGPPDTSLDDPEFPAKLAGYAAQVAQRYPWVDTYTPVNEPNTTARFSGMYGLWFPHQRSRRSYLRMVLQQVKGTVLSMEAIRRVRSDAKLVQTDDAGSISGTEQLRGVWELCNLRQWLTYDLLCGDVNSFHPMFEAMRAEGIAEKEILWFVDHPCPPDVIGLNYYVTSDRYLDHRTHLYPEDRRSAEGPFVDVEAVRVSGVGITGFRSRILEAWNRYRIPVALTEVHLGCAVAEQAQWTMEAWEAAHQARAEGADCVGMTIWALLGSFYWNELVTRENGHYEPGVFDVSNGKPVATEMADVVSQLGRGIAPSSPMQVQQGWWRHESRICFPAEEMDEVAA